MMQYLHDRASSPDSIAGNALALLRRNLGTVKGDGRGERIHLDIGCGLGEAAEQLRSGLGLQLVALGDDGNDLDNLRARGVEVHRLAFDQPDLLVSTIEGLIGGRNLASLSMLNMLGRAHPPAMLAAVRELARRHQAVPVISVSNATHTAHVVSMLLGHDDIAGGDGRSFQSSFSDFSRQLGAAGLRIIDRNDVCRLPEPGHGGGKNPALSPSSKIYRFVEAMQTCGSADAKVYAFVVACLPGPIRVVDDAGDDVGAKDVGRPFLSVITRTQGRRPDELRESLLCLGAQTCRDFEHLIIAHKVSLEARRGIEKAIDALPDWQKGQTRLIIVDDGGRGRPLNVGFSEARGAYVSILDDDDVVFGHWIETFKTLAQETYGRVVRAACVAQRCRKLSILGQPATSAIGTFERRYPAAWDDLQQLKLNATPNHSLSFPRGCFHALKLRFDEGLTTVEDWDFIMQAARVLGVSSVPEITSVYRFWENACSSYTEHDSAEWARNEDVVRRRTAEKPYLLDSGATACVVRPALYASPADTGQQEALHELATLLESTCWKITAALRVPRRLFGAAELKVSDFVGANAKTIQATIEAVRGSRSWRLTGALRALRMRIGT